jgi:hypothetical protein
MVNGTLLNFGKRYKDNLRVIFDQWPKLHLGLDALSNQKILDGIYCPCYVNKVIRYTMGSFDETESEIWVSWAV